MIRKGALIVCPSGVRWISRQCPACDGTAMWRVGPCVPTAAAKFSSPDGSQREIAENDGGGLLPAGEQVAGLLQDRLGFCWLAQEQLAGAGDPGELARAVQREGGVLGGYTGEMPLGCIEGVAQPQSSPSIAFASPNGDGRDPP